MKIIRAHEALGIMTYLRQGIGGEGDRVSLFRGVLIRRILGIFIA